MVTYIFEEFLLGKYKKIKFCKRTNENQTTEYIIQNPIIKLEKGEGFSFSDYLFLDYNNQNLLNVLDWGAKK